ncbi:MAG: toxin-antitoxin system HicB family antitoxin [Chloroflexota bacterium]|nr:toxin-antitoxin system HicB family antitoxin [Chloroflexota bacterium]
MPKGIPLTLRLPQDLHAALVERAQLEGRSLNGQIVFLVRQALFPSVDADAYARSRGGVRAMPEYSLPRPTSQHRRRTS